MRKILSFILTAAVLLSFAVSLPSCKKKSTEPDEIRAALETLIPASAELNEIYFGLGLPTAADEEGYANPDDGLVYEQLIYEQVLPSCKYQTEAELREATLSVFTESYANALFERGFSGLSVKYDDNGLSGSELTSTLYAMYIETDGVLTKRTNVKEEALRLGREYLIDKMTVVRQKNDYVVVDIPTMMDGEESVTVTLKLVITENGWRLDSPTY